MNPFDREPSHRGYVDVTVVEFAAHTAYLDPLTGTGYLVTPRPATDVPAPQDPLVEAAWTDCLDGQARPAGLSLYDADRHSALEHLATEGWEPLLDETGEMEEAGWTTDGRRAVCLYAMPAGGEPRVEALHRALLALDIASGVHVRVRQAVDEGPSAAD
ncbi:hypothetical protein [Kribbella speibonae]|uniref:DUF3293 domain-containing protein n=1 Tax=Kribbella speibonae TaxID=1572660 RepID=A0ABY2AEY8_9ACTN|nr:hypothetical protein [Kribbella speibonae]TCC26876.1 hypothetical protein E0H58_02370 [Kribbella speibonae]